MTVDQSVTDAGSDANQDRGLGRPVAQSADPIDRVVRLAPKWTVFALLGCGLLVLGIIVWAVRGTVTSSVSTAGLYNERGVEKVLTDTQVTVDRVLVTLGQQVTKGQQVVSLVGGGVMVSPQDGSITAILVSDGSLMAPGKAAVRVTDLTVADDVVTIVPASMTGTVVVGLPVPDGGVQRPVVEVRVPARHHRRDQLRALHRRADRRPARARGAGRRRSAGHGARVAGDHQAG